MNPTRRFVLHLGAAALVGAALPQGHIPAVLAAESGQAVDILDNAEAEQEIVGRGKWHLMTREDRPFTMKAAQIFIERLADGSARLVFEPVPPTAATDHAAGMVEAGRFTADPSRVVHELRLDAATLAGLELGIHREQESHRATA